MTKKSGAAAKKPQKAVSTKMLPQLTASRVNFEDKPLVLSREALLLNPRAFDLVKAHTDPLRRGLTILGLILIILVAARGVGALLGYLTTPRFDILEAQVLERVVELDWYAEQVALNPQFDAQFELAYESAWQLIRALGGYPSPAGTLTSIVSAILSLLLSWLTYGAVAHLFARWFGGTASLRQFLGPLALSYAPLLLRALEFIPGLAIATTLVFLLMLVTKFIAVRRTYKLGPGYSLVVVIAPYLVAIVVGAILAAIGIGIGLDQVPYLDPILDFLTA